MVLSKKAIASALDIGSFESSQLSKDGAKVYRSSAVFPCILSASQNCYLLFLNYWVIKNKIDPSDLAFKITIRSEDGRELCVVSISNEFVYRLINLKDVYSSQRADQATVKGSVEFELISASNLVFPFPALTYLIETDGCFSAVHSAGRVKNQDETTDSSVTIESNWQCRFDSSWTPFFHFFRGQNCTTCKSITVMLHDANGVLRESADLSVERIPAYGSRLFYIDEIFNVSEDTNMMDSFISVMISASDTYPRMIVGNYHRATNRYEVTHSYPWHDGSDRIEPSTRKVAGIIDAFCGSGVSLSLRSFPTFGTQSIAPALLNLASSTPVEDSREYDAVLNEFLKGMGRLDIDDFGGRLSLRLGASSFPARVTMSYQFSVSDFEDSNFQTDISDGLKTNLFKPRKFIWGHGAVGGGFRTLLFLRALEFTDFRDARESKIVIELHLFDYSDILKKIIELPLNEVVELDITEFLQSRPDSMRFVAWYAIVPDAHCDAFWLAFNSTNGNIFGDHAF